MAMLGRPVALFLCFSTKLSASKPEMLARDKNVLRSSMVLFLRRRTQASSSLDNSSARRTFGRVEGQSTTFGAYPPLGEFGRARISTELTLGIKAVSSGAAIAVLSQSVRATKPSILTS